MTIDDDPGFGEQWYVSHWNLRRPEVADALSSVIIHDTTLRDGEQHVGVAFSPDEKVAVAESLAGMGVHRIEVGTPASGTGDQDAARRLVEANAGAEVWTLSRSIPNEVDLSASLGVDGVGLACLANDQYLEVFGWTLEKILGMVGSAVERARDHGLQVTVFVADSSRMSKERLAEIIEGVDARCAPDSFALMDTFGALEPDGTAALVQFARSLTAGGIEFHGHNDFGLSVANSIAAGAAGASAVHTAMLGLGERIGNTPLEEFVVAANVLYEARLPIDTTQIMAVATMVAAASGLRPATNKPIVGAFNRIESGLVSTEYVRLVLEGGRPEQWSMPFVPSYVGQSPTELVAGKASGITNIRIGLAGTDYEGIDDDAARRILERVQERANETKRAFGTEDLILMAAELAALGSS